MQSGDRPGDLEPQQISIWCQLGASEADELIMTFSGLPGHRNLPWLQHFSDQARMVFTHTCIAQDFMAQAELQDKQLCEGLISSATGGEKFESIARRLRSSCLGLLCHNGEYCVIVFASEGEGVTGEHGIDLGVSSSCLLKHSIIKPSTCLEPSMLAPLTSADSRVGPDTGPMQDVPVFDMFFKFEYDQLLPPLARREDRHRFFLAFPPSAGQEACLISQWLRYFDADCDVRTSLHPGSWSGFLKLGQGTLILHEDALWAVRLFPKLAILLCAPSGTVKFFLLKRAEPLLHMPPSRDLSSLGGSGGETQLCPILRPGTAFLVTPSFLASQPEQAYIFVKWFWQNYSRNSRTYFRGKLVVCSDIEDWTLDLVVKSRGSDEEMQRPGTSPKSAEMRIKMLGLLRTLMTDSADETDGLVVFAPDVINGSDEQSLVNWFGWWAIMNMDQLRTFSVIGSGNQHLARLALCIQLPNYHKAAPAESQQPASDNHVDSAAHQSQGAAWQLVYNDGAGALVNYISQAEEAFKQAAFRPMSLYRYPVSYWDPDMAYHFKDYSSDFKSFRAWLNYFPEFVNVGSSRWGGRGIYNSYAGLFYTIEDAFDRTKYPQGVTPTRRPWVAILRPTSPHRRPWSKGELFIWDCTAWAQYPGDSAVHLNDLICAQRELVKIIQEESQSPFELPLERVWLGGSTADCEGHRYSEPLDITLNWLANLPPNIKNLVPAPYVKIPERNWKEVLPGHGPGKPAEPKATSPMDEDMPESEVTGPKSMIFRAPRVDGEAWRPECRNLLHEWAERTRRLNKSAVRAEYSFEPTMKWYNEQVQKGQGLCHLDVSPWKVAFNRLKIPDPKDVSD
ncbi:chromo domain-containing protein [Ophiocordyceps sinensis CO18]|uniref:Chromo domain-containing protein n=1 Tax=Ophiocordyceps sinensis (strain Co18 / CGMCC 3.14243) TaxID=911162 RepID=T5AQX5_OPHSC|nr:chromo domain-containing protein [Ophiocordyceps sinensis CO18]